jgi:hypothetical protein
VKRTPWSESFVNAAKHVPWPLVLLALGVILAILAMLVTNRTSIDAAVLFVVGGLSLVAGLFSLILQHVRERQEQTKTEEFLPLRIYRQTPCMVEAELVKRYAQAIRRLRNWVEEHNWDVSLEEADLHAAQSERYAQAGQWRDAFREQCRAISKLMDVVQAYRMKEDHLPDLWQDETREE